LCFILRFVFFQPAVLPDREKRTRFSANGLPGCYNDFMERLEGQTAELRRLSAIKDDFLAITTHELRTPLHGMIGIADSLIHDASNPLPPAVKSDLNIIISSDMRLSNLVNYLLVASKLKQKK